MSEEIFFNLVFISGILYLLLHLAIFIGIKLAKYFLQSDSQLKNISVIIATRNEEENISNCIKSILNQNYPKDKFEIIVVNDRSSDGTKKIVEEFKEIKLINIEELPIGVFGKKNALRIGIEESKNDILVFTDADCLPENNWLRNISNYFDEKTGAVVGYSPYKYSITLPKLLNDFIEYEELKTSLYSFGAIGLGNGFLATGRNLSYRRKVYDEVEGYKNINHSISGDDDLFLQQIQTKTNWRIKYMSDDNSFVFTNPPKDFKDFYTQRLRHLSASKHYSLFGKLFFGAIHLNSILILINLFLIPAFGILFLFLKIFVDLIFIESQKYNLKSKIQFFKSIYLEIFLVIYYFVFGVISIFKKPKWNLKTN
ncbi:MAG: glycosyltransferase [Bacteroidota bacterium]